MFKSVRLGRILAALTVAVLCACPAMAWPPGGNGGGGNGNGGGGGGEDPPPPSYDLPPFEYAIATIQPKGMGNYYDTNDYGLTGISVRPLYVSDFIDTDYDLAAAALVHPDGTVDYLDNLIDPALPYDLGAAVAVNNAGQVFASGFAGDGSGAVRAFLLSPNPDAATDGYEYDVTLVALPDWGAGWSLEVNFSSMKLTEAGDTMYTVHGTHTDGSSDTAYYVRWNDGTIEELGLPHVFNNASSRQAPVGINSLGTILINGWDEAIAGYSYLVEADGTVISPQDLTGVDSAPEINVLAENGYSCGVQTLITGQYKKKGQWYNEYRSVPVVYDPNGNAAFVPFRDESGDAHSSLQRINEQIVDGLPVTTGFGDGGWYLSYPGYDAAFLYELMDDANRAAYDALGGLDIKTLSTPRLPSGEVDNNAAPMFWGDLDKVVYPNGQSGVAGISVVFPVTP